MFYSHENVPMLSIKEARVLAENQLKDDQTNSCSKHEFVIMDEHTREYDFGWIFFYQTRLFVETRNEDHMLFGNAPMLVDKQTGILHFTGTALPIEEYIENYRKFGTPHPTDSDIKKHPDKRRGVVVKWLLRWLR